MSRFSSVFVANRGEIALRIMKTARAQGLATIAIYTDADRDAPHVAFADRAVNIGAGPIADSYLNIEKVIAAAQSSGAEAVHPGYGFLSENTAFAKACATAGLVFIGPPAQAVELMGNKASAKRKMIAAGVPCVPGYEGTIQSDETLAQEAKKIGYPVMIKAAAGGGGRGMRLVETAEGFTGALATARSEALGAFGSDEMILEKAVLRPRHVEIQVFADTHGNVVHLGERDCSVQRRHQKVVEEAPCPIMTDDLRTRMGQAAVEAAKAVDYVGAGTVEFLLDAGGDFYFLEMNTRLQVEHPVTEMVTGRDLVALQFAVAQGQPLGVSQDDVTLNGHAIEVRLYAENPDDGFLPSTGQIHDWQPPNGAGIRVDGGIAKGQEISPFYDPMLAKIIGFGDTREQALTRLNHALSETILLGPATNRGFLKEVLSRDPFRKGAATTAFIEEQFGADTMQRPVPFGEVALAAVLAWQTQFETHQSRAVLVADELMGWSSTGALQSRLTLANAGQSWPMTVTRQRDGKVLVNSGSNTAEITFDPLRVDGQKVDVSASYVSEENIHIATATRDLTFGIVHAAAEAQTAASGDILAPMHGQLVEISVAVGDKVEVGTRLGVLEAMKMQHDLAADVAGTVRFVATPGQINVGALIVEIEE